MPRPLTDPIFSGAVGSAMLLTSNPRPSSFTAIETSPGLQLAITARSLGCLAPHDEHVSRFSFGRGPALSTNNVLRSYSAHRTPERTSIAPFRVVELRHLVIWIPRRGRL